MELAYALMAVGLASMLGFVAGWLLPRAELLMAVAIVVICLLYLGQQRVWREWRTIVRLAAVVAGIALGYLSILYLWHFGQSIFSLASSRFEAKGAFPVDNVIPYLFSDRLAMHAGTHLIVGDWNGGDRPPLLAGFILLLRGSASAVGVGADVSAFGTSIAGELLWIPGLYAAMRAAGVARLPSRLALLFAAVTGTTLINSVYTWPKMMSAAYVFVAVALLLDAYRRPRVFRWAFPSAVVAFVFGVLAHGVAAFTLPLVVVLGIMAYRRQPRRRIITTTLTALGAALIVYLPWIAYQRFADPPGDRLLKWHLAGVIPIDDRSFFQSIIDSYSHLSLSEWLAGRWQNLAEVFDPDLFRGIGLNWASIENRRDLEIHHLSFALGFAFPVDVVLLLVVSWRIFRKVSDLRDRQFAFIIGLSLASILFWCLLMFIPGATVVNQGSQVWVFAFLVSPIVWLWHRSRVVSVVLLVAQASAMLVVYIPMPGAGPLRLPALLLGIASAVGLFWAVFAGPWFTRALGSRPSLAVSETGA
jgi:hypothetical protein